MMVKVEEDPELPPPVDGDDYYDDEEEDEETDGEGDGDGAATRLKKGPWTPDEDRRLRDYVQAHGEGNWNQVRINAGLNRCGKSCRLRWSNHLRPDLKKGPFDDEEVEKILRMHISWGNKWAKMAALLPGRTDNEIKNYWNTRLKRHQRAGLPIYPEYLVSQASNQDMNFGTPEESCGTKLLNEVSPNVLDIDNLFCDYFDHKAFSKLVPNMGGDLPSPSVVGPNSLPMDAMNPLKLLKSSDCIASDYSGSLSFVQIPDESEKAGCSTSFSYGMTENQLAPLGNANTSGHPIFDGYSSTSLTSQRPMKSELPSVQYSNYGICNAWVPDCPLASIEQADTFIESSGSLKSESISSQNTVLDAIVHKGDGIVDPIMPQGVFEMPPPPFSCNQDSQSNVSSMWHSFSPVLGDDEIEGCPFGEIQASKPPSNSDADSNRLIPSWADIEMFDASLESNLLDDGDSFEEARLTAADHGLDSFPWNRMPGA